MFRIKVIDLRTNKIKFYMGDGAIYDELTASIKAEKFNETAINCWAFLDPID